MRCIEDELARRTTFCRIEIRMDHLDVPTALTVAAALAVSALAYPLFAAEPESLAEVDINIKRVPINQTAHKTRAPAAVDSAVQMPIVEESR